MKPEDYIDDYIQRERQTKPNPFLSTKVLTKVDELEKSSIKKMPLWQTVSVAASIAIAAYFGISVGNSYIDNQMPEVVMNINDSQIENLSYYNFDDYE